MFNERTPNENAKSIAVVLHEIKDALKEFLQTRYAIRERLDVRKRVAPRVLPLSGAAAVLGLLVGYGVTSLITD